MDRRKLLVAGAGLIGRLALPGGVVAVTGCSGSASAPGTLGFQGASMGTTYSVRLGAPLEAEPFARLQSAVKAAVAGVDARMSTYDAGSELSRFNSAADTGWQTLSADTTAVIARALATSRSSDGAFDTTVGPLVNLWGFGPDGSVSHAPRQHEVAAMRERIGWRHIEVDTGAKTVRKTRPDAYVDLSGIAKGFAVDRVRQLLVEHGVDDFLVEIGGELASGGARPDGQPWRIAIEQPVAGARRLQRLVDLKGRAIATSGDYRNFFDDRGRRYSHTIDPRDGSPVAHALAAVSVIADTTTEADAASTALMVLGPEAGPDWAREQGIAALFLSRDGGVLGERMTPTFETHLVG